MLRCSSAACFPPKTFRCKPTSHGQNSQQNLGEQSRLYPRIQHEIRRAQSTDSHLLEAVGEDLLEEEKEEVTELTSRFLHTGSMAHQVNQLTFVNCANFGHLQVLVLLPFVKSGAEKKLETNSSLMLAEAEALVRTLEWKVLLTYPISLPGPWLSSSRVVMVNPLSDLSCIIIP